jgi:hypothetical protein
VYRVAGAGFARALLNVILGTKVVSVTASTLSSVRSRSMISDRAPAVRFVDSGGVIPTEVRP